MDSALYKRYKPLCDYFRVKDGNAGVYRQFALLWEYAREHSNHGDSAACMAEIARLSHQIGSPVQGEKPWSKMVVYVSTQNHLKALDALEEKGETDGTAAEERSESVVQSIRKALEKAARSGGSLPAVASSGGGGSGNFVIVKGLLSARYVLKGY